MTSDSDYIASLLSVQTHLYRYGGPILIGVGTMSCILSFRIFIKKNLRKNPCSIYFMAYNVTNFLSIYTSILLSILSTGFNITATSYNLNLCRFYLYALFLFDILNPFYLILASIDRILVTSRNAATRRRSTRRIAYICIISGAIFWMIFNIHTIILGNIIEAAPNYFVCYSNSATYTTAITYYSLIIKAIFVPSLMAFLGIWAIKNIRIIRGGRVGPALSTSATVVENVMNASRSKDRQLIKILFVNISIYIIFNMMLSIVLMYQEVTRYNTKTQVETQIENLLSSIGLFSYYIPFCIGCFSNLVVSKTFRKEIKNVLLCK